MPTNKVLVVGGAGYIGSHMVVCLKKAGFQPIVLDNLSTGHADTLSDVEHAIGDVGDLTLLDQIFAQHNFIAVMHFAAFIQVNESVKNPLKYYQNNVATSLSLLQTMLKWNVKKFIFSSTAAVYGEPQYTPIDEQHPRDPINPYGYSKRMMETILDDFSRAYNLKYAALRYFNAAGADPSGQLSERHDPETHLIPLILQASENAQSSITVFGRNYPTPDGTCVRDFIHVSDVCTAHLLALQALLLDKKHCIYNLGTGIGHSVQQVIDAAFAITQKKITIIEGPRREGDPAILVADPTRAFAELQWKPQFSDLHTIIKDAWRAFKKN